MFDWHQFQHDEHPPPVVVDSRKRVRICGGLFLVLMLVVFARVVQLEVSHGAAYRAEATRPLQKTIEVPGLRGRILARDGTVLAADRKIPSLAIHYRWLQEPPDPRWLRRTARRRLSPSARKNPRRVAEQQERVLAERAAARRRLAKLAGLTPDQWTDRAKSIQTRVQRIAQRVNRKGKGDCPPLCEAPGKPFRQRRTVPLSFLAWLGTLADPPPPPRIVVAEEEDYHVMVDTAGPPLVDAVRDHPDRYPGTKIVERLRRVYPHKTLAANLLGHLGPPTRKELGFRVQDSGDPSFSRRRDADEPNSYHPDDLLGRLGLEKQYESVLRARRGTKVEITEHGGRVLSTFFREPPRNGRDLQLTLDLRVQQAAEKLLDQRKGGQSPFAGTARRVFRTKGDCPPFRLSGAIIVMDPQTGALLAAASAPRFDPNLFVSKDPAAAAALLDDPAHPLFDRAARMAIAPGSVFKIVTAVALLEAKTVDPEEPFFCNGYLKHPDRQRCAIFVQQGIGHGQTTLSDALCVSCNVYFFHHAARLGCDPLVAWAERFGFGRPTGADLPGEAAGTAPNPENIRRLENHDWKTSDTQNLSVGQGSLTATPLQIAVLMAAVVNGGKLVTPHLVVGSAPPPRPLPGLHESTLKHIRTGLRRVVADPAGTAHETVYLQDLSVAGKTGTAETAAGRPHAWFAGYAPAEDPKSVFVVVLEHGGEAAATAAPIAKRLVRRLRQLGIL